MPEVWSLSDTLNFGLSILTTRNAGNRTMFPIKKPVELHSGDIDYSKTDIKGKAIFPVQNHPGSFGYPRKNHRHEGVDIYCENDDPVYSIEDGIVVGIFEFTGEKAGSPWWNDTQCILVKGASFVINYGEIEVNNVLQVGDHVKEGDLLGKVKQVLKVDKGRPMCMLHLELYEKNTTEPVKEWGLGKKRPQNLYCPTNFLMQQYFKENLKK